MRCGRLADGKVRRLAAFLIAALIGAALLGGCQPLPHPFADDWPPAELLRIRDSAGISVAPIAGGPKAMTTKLGSAVASALLKHDIPASDKTTSLGSYLLYGRLAQSLAEHGSAKVTAYWRLYTAGGKPIGDRKVDVEAPVKEWEAAAGPPIERLAAASAAAIAPLIEDKMPMPEAAASADQDAGRLRVAVEPLSGAPGDGDKSLAAAVRTVLQRQDLAIVAPGQKADLTIDGKVSVAPVKPDQQHVRILWRLRRADGAEIGTVGQENDVPRGMLEGPWGDLAYSVAIAASDGLMQLVAHAGPPGKS
jgi:hypothetical protein